MPDINVDVPKLEAVKTGFEVARAAAISAEAAWAAQLAADAAASFACLGLNAAKIAYDSHCVEALHKFQGLCQVGADGIDGAIKAYQGADSGDARMFAGQGGGGSGGDQAGPLSPFNRGMNTINTILQGHGVAVDLDDYDSGVDGWSVISHDGSQGFSTNELVSQKGGTCALYAPQNLLIESGYDITQAQAQTNAHQALKENVPWFWNVLDLPDEKWEGGFDMDVSEQIIAKTTSNYHRGDFNEVTQSDGFWPQYGPNRGKAEDFLVKTVQGGQPVLVSMELDDSFGMGDGGHRATVVGVKTDSNGNLTDVLVGTNWNGEQVYAIPGKQFMDDWMDRSGGAYITVDRPTKH
jgi:hypothetical protein